MSKNKNDGDKAIKLTFPLLDDLKFRAAVFTMVAEILSNQKAMERMLLRVVEKTTGEDRASLAEEFASIKTDILFDYIKDLEKNL